MRILKGFFIPSPQTTLVELKGEFKRTVSDIDTDMLLSDVTRAMAHKASQYDMQTLLESVGI